MDPITRQAIAVATGAAGTEPGLYVDDVFSTYLYEGNASGQGANAQSISNSIDLSGEGGLVWIKNRELGGSNAWSHYWFDTERGATEYIRSNDVAAEIGSNYSLSAFNSDGFTLGETGGMNNNGSDYVSWTFRKAPGFFDVVTYTGNGVQGREIPHALASKPGMMIVKRTDAANIWAVYHRSRGATKYLRLNESFAESGSNQQWSYTEPTDSVFTVHDDASVNISGGTYVAYLFAHDDQSFGTNGDESIIKCGSFTTNSSGVFSEVNLGFEPQFLIIKRSDSSVGGTWLALDNMRGLGAGESNFLYPNLTNAEANNSVGFVHLTPTGFKGASPTQQQTNATYIYMAIRRPHKPPTAGTDVFTAALNGTPGSSGATQWRPENVDMAWFAKRGGDSKNFHVADRIRGFQNTDTNGDDSYTTLTLQTNKTSNELTSGTAIHQSHYSNGVIDVRAVSSGSNFLFYRFKRAPGFFDVVAYTGNGSAGRTVDHNLTVVPELMIVKNRDDYYNWRTYDSINGATKYMFLNSTSASAADTSVWNNTGPTATQFTVGSSVATNKSGDGFVAYLFATLDGISKVGSYSGTGNNVDIDCGFASGARFVLIKRTDSSGGWYVWDTERGITSGNDPYLLLNSTAAEVTNTDYIDPLNAGFTVTSSAPAALNTSGGTYLFLAIA